MTFNVLVAEPDDQAWAMIANSIKQYRADADLLRVKDGEQAMRFLFYRGLFTEAPETPDLVVLARDLPTMSAQVVVARLRQHPRTLNTPVIVSGHWRRRSDVEKAREYRQWVERQQWLIAVRAEDLARELTEAVRRLSAERVPIEIEDREASSAI